MEFCRRCCSIRSPSNPMHQFQMTGHWLHSLCHKNQVTQLDEKTHDMQFLCHLLHYLLCLEVHSSKNMLKLIYRLTQVYWKLPMHVAKLWWQLHRRLHHSRHKLHIQYLLCHHYRHHTWKSRFYYSKVYMLHRPLSQDAYPHRQCHCCHNKTLVCLMLQDHTHQKQE